jgi:hypothetical protein
MCERTLEDLFEELDWVEENLGEIETQHIAETNHYGDSWPGAQIQIRELKERIAFLNDQIKIARRGLEIQEFEIDDIPY